MIAQSDGDGMLRQEELWRHEEAEERAAMALAELRDAA
jgi:hypothetical protein